MTGQRQTKQEGRYSTSKEAKVGENGRRNEVVNTVARSEIEGKITLKGGKNGNKK